jgi:hypothetical protein
MKSLHVMTLGVAMSLAISGVAQTPEASTAPPTAPLPSALAKATKLFIGNAGDQENADCLRAYNSFYDGISKLGRFTLVLDPSEADLVLELHYEIALGQSVVSEHNANASRQFRVVIEAPHSRIVLWSLTERTNYAVRQANRDKNLDQTVATLVSDFNLLAAPQPFAPNNKSRVKHDSRRN